MTTYYAQRLAGNRLLRVYEVAPPFHSWCVRLAGFQPARHSAQCGIA